MQDNTIESKYVYTIYGLTNKGKCVNATIGTLDFAIQQFLSRYPRFNGQAKIYRCIPHRIKLKEMQESAISDMDKVIDSICHVNSDESINIFSFSSSKELKENKQDFLITEDTFLRYM